MIRAASAYDTLLDVVIVIPSLDVARVSLRQEKKRT